MFYGLVGTDQASGANCCGVYFGKEAFNIAGLNVMPRRIYEPE